MAYPTILGRDGTSGATADSTSFAIPFASAWDANLAGDRLLAFVSADGNPTLSTMSAGWTKVQQHAGSTQVVGALFEWVAGADGTAVPDLVVDSDQAQQFSARTFWVRSATGALARVHAVAGGSNAVPPDPPGIANGAAATDQLVLVSYHGDSTPAPGAAPANYTGLAVQAAGGTGGATTATAERQVAMAPGASEDPGAFAIGTQEQWSAFTVGYSEASAAAGGQMLAWDGTGWTRKPVRAFDGQAFAARPVKHWNGNAWEVA